MVACRMAWGMARASSSGTWTSCSPQVQPPLTSCTGIWLVIVVLLQRVCGRWAAIITLHIVNKPHPLGPTPLRPSKETDEPPAGRVLAALAEHVHPVTTAELVSQLGLHPNTVRSHLQELVDVGMVARETVPPAGRGRPAHRYRITDEGRAVPTVSDPAFAEYRGLTTAFASYLAARSAEPSAEARQIGRAWGAQLAESDPTSRPGDTATRRVTRLLSKLGFSPVPGPSPADGLA